MPEISHWGAGDLHVLASLFVEVMVSAASELVSPSADQPAVLRGLIDNPRNQARLTVVGAAGWQPLKSSRSLQRLRRPLPSQGIAFRTTAHPPLSPKPFPRTPRTPA